MKSNELSKKLLELYYIYENYCLSNNQEMYVLITKTEIQFLLLKDNQVIDEITFTFNDKEKDKIVHDYLALFLTIKIFGNVQINIEGCNIYNDTHRSYLYFEITDESILDKVKLLKGKQSDEIINEENEELQKLYRKAKNFYVKIPKQIVNDRIDVTKKVIREM